MTETKVETRINVLFVDDEEKILRSIKRLLMDEDFETLTATSGEDALKLLGDHQNIGLIVSDQRMPGMQGVEFLKRAGEIAPDTLRIMLTGYMDINSAIDAVNKGGAYQYITKPWKDEELIRIVREAVRRYALIIENRSLTETVKRQNEELTKWNDQLQDRVREQTAELQESEERYRKLFDEAPVGYHELDQEGNIIHINRTELDMLGYRAEDMLGQPFWKFITAPDERKQLFQEQIAGGLPARQAVESAYCRKNGTVLSVLIRDKLLKDKSGRIMGIRTTVQDITEFKQAEEKMMLLQKQFFQAQKMEAVGRLTGGVAHDFNNLLTIIKGYSEMSLIGIEATNPLKENLDEILRASDRASDLTRRLLAFSRNQIMELGVYDLNFLLEDLNKILRRIIGEHIELVIRTAEDLGRVKVDPGQIEQVIMNLAVNARDAMSSGGNLTIETANVELDDFYKDRYPGAAPGRYVELLVTDTGTGMTSEITEHIFEPFFTTKERDKGTGLGLSVVYGIVEQTGGHIWVKSEPGRGTAFTILLPRVEAPLEARKGREEGRKIPNGYETILVAEDETVLLKLISKVLRKQGYKVLEASCGSDALTLYKNAKEPVHLLLTDIVMPKMNGIELAEQCRTQGNPLKVILMSGYVENLMAQQEVLEKGIPFLLKPFNVYTLARKVRDVLDQNTTSSTKK